MQDEPIDEKIILDELSEIHKLDYNYSDGRILGSMCTEAHPFAKEVYCKFLDTNLGDPGLFKGTKLIEEKVIASIGDLLSLDNAYGNIVTGGTEANLPGIMHGSIKALLMVKLSFQVLLIFLLKKLPICLI